MTIQDMDLTGVTVKIAINPEYGDDVMFCQNYESGVPCCDFGIDTKGRHALGVLIDNTRLCVLVTANLMEFIDWQEDFSKIVRT